jgi:hypothetical protein
MYKQFHNNIKLLSLVIGYLNLVRSFYYQSANGNVDDADYMTADENIYSFKMFCRNFIRQIEILLKDQNAQVKFVTEKLEKIETAIESASKPASQGIVEEIFTSFEEIREFVDFLCNKFSSKVIDRVDLKEIKTELKVFKYQIYLS